MNKAETLKNAIKATYRALIKAGDFSHANKFDQSQQTHHINIDNFNLNLDADVVLARADADFKAFKQLFHKQRIHAKLKPQNIDHALIFNALEDARIEALGTKKWSGAGDNTNAGLEAKYEKMALHTTLDGLGKLAYAEAVKLVARKQFLKKDYPKHSKPIIDKCAIDLNKKLLNAICQLEKNIHNQQNYATMVCTFLNVLGENIPPDEMTKNDDLEAEETSANDFDKTTQNSEQKDAQAQDAKEKEESTEPQTPSDDEMHRDEESGDGEIAPTHNQNIAIDAQENYKIFTTEFDKTQDASSITTQKEAEELREKLDNVLKSHINIISKLANRLQRKLQAKQLRSWSFDLEEGLLDSSKLTQIICNPNNCLSFKQEDDSDFQDTVITLLVDNSGSMRGRPIALAAMACDILVQTLERCAVKVEVLGFTTARWKGGESFEKWAGAGAPSNAGRLNDIRHIIYKSANDRYSKCRKNFALMLKEGLLKENIDGEALLWATSRLQVRFENRKILMIVSDGAPVDDATLSNNKSGYLDKHLRYVIDKIENHTNIELLAIGIGHDVSRYYKSAITIANADTLADVMSGELINLFDKTKKSTKKSTKKY